MHGKATPTLPPSLTSLHSAVFHNAWVNWAAIFRDLSETFGLTLHSVVRLTQIRRNESCVEPVWGSNSNPSDIATHF